MEVFLRFLTFLLSVNEYAGSIFINKTNLSADNKQSINSKASDDAGHLEQTISL